VLASGERMCSKCGQTKPISGFSPHKSGIGDGYHGWCKVCRSEAEWFRRNNPRLIEAHKNKYERNHAYRARTVLRNVSKRCRREGIAFDLDDEWLVARLAAGVCEVTGLRFDMSLASHGKSKVRRNPMTPSIDRIIPADGYVKTNCRVVVYALNAAMSEWGLETFLPIAEAIRGSALTSSCRLIALDRFY